MRVDRNNVKLQTSMSLYSEAAVTDPLLGIFITKGKDPSAFPVETIHQDKQ